MQQHYQDRLQTDNRLQQMMNQRKDLPVFNKRQEILAAVYDNPVTIIRGNTGCGKTTQVPDLFHLALDSLVLHRLALGFFFSFIFVLFFFFIHSCHYFCI